MTWSVASDGWACLLKRRANKVSARARSREGYVALLAVSFAFALVTLGTALAVSLRGYLAAAGRTERAILDRISMESAAAAHLGKVAAGEAVAVRPLSQAEILLNGRRIALETSLPDGKRDPSTDTSAEISEAFAQAGLTTPVGPLKSTSLAALSESEKLSSSQEDCLRRWVTFGRSPAPYEPGARQGSTEDEVQGLSAGDQLDLRLSLRGRQGVSVLWLRVRMVGGNEGWVLHDYRPLARRNLLVECTVGVRTD